MHSMLKEQNCQALNVNSKICYDNLSEIWSLLEKF